MKNPLRQWMDDEGISIIDVAFMIRADPTSIYRWASDKSWPSKRNALKLYKKSRGTVPFTYWGFVMLEKGQIMKVSDESIQTPKAQESGQVQ